MEKELRINASMFRTKADWSHVLKTLDIPRDAYEVDITVTRFWINRNAPDQNFGSPTHRYSEKGGKDNVK